MTYQLNLNTAQRTAIIPVAGRLILDTTLNEFFVGDGVTVGGIQAPAGLANIETYTGLTTAATSVPYLVVISGQSNAQASGGTDGTRTIPANTFVWNGNGTTTIGTALVTPAYSSTPFGADTNSVFGFCNELRNSGKIPASRPIIIVCSFQGGMPIENWLGNQLDYAYWTNLQNALNSITVIYPGIKINHVMWLQGEANRNGVSGTTNGLALANSQSTYAARFASLITQYKALSQWAYYSTFTMSEMGPWGSNFENDRNDFVSQLKVYDDPKIGPVSANNTVMTTNGSSPAHFDGASLYLLGQRHFWQSQVLALNIGHDKLPRTPNGYEKALPNYAVVGTTYVFTVSGVTTTPAIGTKYTNNGQTFTVQFPIITAGSGLVVCYGTGAPGASGTLTKSTTSGDAGDATIAFSAQTSTVYSFTYSGVSTAPVPGAIYTNNGQTFTVLTVVGISTGTSSGTIYCVGTGAASASGTLTKSSGTGDATITFSATSATATYPYVIDYDLSRNGIAIQATGACTIVFPDSNKIVPGSYQIRINNQVASAISITTFNNIYTGAGNFSTNTTVALQNSYNEWCWTANGADGWTLAVQPINGSFRYLQASQTGSASLGTRGFCNSMYALFAGTAYSVTASPTFVLGGTTEFFYRGGLVPTGSLAYAYSVQLVKQQSKVVVPGSGYVPGDTVTLAGGTFSTAATVTVVTTQVASATVAAGGSGGTNGTQLVTGTTGTGTKFTAYVTVAGNAITAILQIVTGGSYTVNPTTISAEPVTGAGLSGAQLNVVMGVNSIDDASTAGVGTYSVIPTDLMTQGSTTGAGSGVKIRGMFYNAITRHPKWTEQTITTMGVGQRYKFDGNSINWAVGYDPLHVNPTLPLDLGSALSSSTLTQTQMCQGRSYNVAASAAIVLAYQTGVEVGRTAFIADYSTGFTLAAQTGDRILWNGTLTAGPSTISVGANKGVIVEALGNNLWFVTG